MEDKMRYTVQVEVPNQKKVEPCIGRRSKKRTILECWNSCDSLPSRVVSLRCRESGSERIRSKIAWNSVPNMVIAVASNEEVRP